MYSFPAEQLGRLTFFSSRSNDSSPITAVTYFFLFRSMRLIVMTLLASISACLASAASAFAVFFWASFAARFWASTDSDAVAASRASGENYMLWRVRIRSIWWFIPADQMRLYSSGSFFSSHSWHFLTVPPYSQYYLGDYSVGRVLSGGNRWTRKGDRYLRGQSADCISRIRLGTLIPSFCIIARGRVGRTYHRSR